MALLSAYNIRLTKPVQKRIPDFVSSQKKDSVNSFGLPLRSVSPLTSTWEIRFGTGRKAKSLNIDNSKINFNLKENVFKILLYTMKII